MNQFPTLLALEHDWCFLTSEASPRSSCVTAAGRCICSLPKRRADVCPITKWRIQRLTLTLTTRRRCIEEQRRRRRKLLRLGLGRLLWLLFACARGAITGRRWRLIIVTGRDLCIPLTAAARCTAIRATGGRRRHLAAVFDLLTCSRKDSGRVYGAWTTLRWGLQ
jgi:hypothetical protein